MLALADSLAHRPAKNTTTRSFLPMVSASVIHSSRATRRLSRNLVNLGGTDRLVSDFTVFSSLSSRAVIGGWTFATSIADYELGADGRPGPLLDDTEVTRSLSEVRTRLNHFTEEEQERLINWGYAAREG